MSRTDSDFFDNVAFNDAIGAGASSFTVHFAPWIRSTIDIMSWCSEQGITPGSGIALAAGDQARGVGQHGQWAASSRDLKLSILLPEVIDAKAHYLRSCATSVAILRTLRELETPQSSQFRIKLLNDVLVQRGDHFCKISGSILIGEHDPTLKQLLTERDGFQFSREFSVLSIGINLEHYDRHLEEPSFPPTSLEELSGILVARDYALGILLRNLDRTLELAQTDQALLCREMQEHMARGPGDRIVLKTKSGEVKNVRLLGVSPDGLEIEEDGARKLVSLTQLERCLPFMESA